MTDTGTARTASVRSAPRWLLVTLLASLALNLVVIGVVGGAMWRFRDHRHVAGNAITPNLLGYASTLPPERRRALWAITAEERGRVRPFRREIRMAREETIKAFIAEPFDKQRFLAAQERQAETEHQAREAVRHLYAKLAEALTAEERRAFPRWRDRRRPPGHNLLDEPDQQAGEAPSGAER
jgi:uncharacterized membrane protein